MSSTVRLLYLYLFSFIGLIITVIGLVRLVDLGLKVFVFREADSFEMYAPTRVMEKPNEATAEAQVATYDRDLSRRELSRQRQRTVAEALAMILVGSPLYLYHWKQIKLDNLNQQSAKVKKKSA